MRSISIQDKLGDKKITYRRYENKIFKFIQKKKISNNVHFLGILNALQVRNIIKKQGGVGLVNLSYSVIGETFCMSALEMESYGIPIISRQKNDGLNTTIKDGQTGFLCKNNKKIISNIKYIFSSEKLYNKFSYNCQKYVGNFSISKTIDEWFSLLKNYNITSESKHNLKLLVKIKKKINCNFYTLKEIWLRFKGKVITEYYKSFMR